MKKGRKKETNKWINKREHQREQHKWRKKKTNGGRAEDMIKIDKYIHRKDGWRKKEMALGPNKERNKYEEWNRKKQRKDETNPETK